MTERELFEQARGDVHHYINPVIGAIRYALHKGVVLEAHELEWVVNKLLLATDAVDAGLGEIPMRDQIAALKNNG
jgi:hypothetical protein